MSSEVYFAQRRATQGGGLLEKLDQLCDAAGFGPLLAGSLVAIRVAFGEVGNSAFIRPAFAHRVVRKLRFHGAQPFLTDGLVLGSTRRPTAVEHLMAAAAHGWKLPGEGAPLMISDGLLGHDARQLVTPGGEVSVGGAIVEAEGLLGIGHFTGHEVWGVAGAIYGLGYSTASLAGKQAILGGDAGDLTAKRARRERLVEAAVAVAATKQRKLGFVAMLIDITPGDDDLEWSDAAVVPDIGILASRDPVALDQACIDLFQQAPGIPGTILADPASKDKLKDLFPGADWDALLAYAEQRRLGTRDYELMII